MAGATGTGIFASTTAQGGMTDRYPINLQFEASGS
jgi:hypothetical protein